MTEFDPNLPKAAPKSRSAAVSRRKAGITRLGLRDSYVPENRRSELENALDILSESGGLYPFSPGDVGHFAQGDLLDLVAELQAFRLISRADPVGGQLLKLRNVRPAEPGAR